MVRPTHNQLRKAFQDRCHWILAQWRQAGLPGPGELARCARDLVQWREKRGIAYVARDVAAFLDFLLKNGHDEVYPR